jgi:hypothetical protein
MLATLESLFLELIHSCKNLLRGHPPTHNRLGAHVCATRLEGNFPNG